ncbi:unnamed protein product [Choristocarpus tenellus]
MNPKAAASIAELDDHPVKDTAEARADRMLDALAALPADEQLEMGLDVDALRTAPLSYRLPQLEVLWTRRQEELKEVYEAMAKPGEVLGARIDTLQDASASQSEVEEALVYLEDVLSDIDMAKDFHAMGGFPVLTSMLQLNKPEATREKAAWAIGTTVRNDLDSQLWVLQGGPHGEPSALVLLLENAVAAAGPTLRTKVVFALASCLSNSPEVQLIFSLLRGESALSSMYTADGTTPTLRTRILVLLSDLSQEAAQGSGQALGAMAPLGLGEGSGEWCRRAHHAVGEASQPAALEKVLQVVRSFKNVCVKDFASLRTGELLQRLGEQYGGTGVGGASSIDEGYRQELHLALHELASSLQ